MPGRPPMQPGTELSSKRQRRENLTVEQKRRLCEKHRAEPKLRQTELCAWAKLEFGLSKAPSQGAMSCVLRAEHLLKDSAGSALGARRKKMRHTRHDHLDRVLANWALEQQALAHSHPTSRTRLTPAMIQHRGRELATQLGVVDQLRFSNGWVHSFMLRHGLKPAAGEKSTLPDAPGLDHEVSMGAHEDLPPVSTGLTQREMCDVVAAYEPRNVYAVGEAGLLFRASPATLARGVDLAQEPRLTALLAVNADASDLVEPCIVGDVLAPKTLEPRGFHYVSSSQAKLTVLTFQHWLRNFNSLMASAHRHVLVLLDDAPSHAVSALALSHVRVVQFASALDWQTDPMRGGGLLQTFKAKYRVQHLSVAVARLHAGHDELYHAPQLQAMRWIADAWRAMPAALVMAAWQPLGVSPTMDLADAKKLEQELDRLLRELHFDGLVAPAALTSSVWEDDVHKRLDEELIESPEEDAAEFVLPPPEPHPEVAASESETLASEAEADAFATVIGSLERKAATTADPQFLADVLDFLRGQQRHLRAPSDAS